MTEDTPDLREFIAMQIRAAGPISIASYMGLCLTHPKKGYYRKTDPLGVRGDFVTAPEITQMFGELIGVWVVNIWAQMGMPERFTLLELGPGRGTLMADALRVATRTPGFAAALDLALFEANPVLVAEQRKRLAQYGPEWIDDVGKIGEAPLVVVANEFFDALPIRQFVRRGAHWYERCVGLTDGDLAYGLAPTPMPDGVLPAEVHNAEDGEVYELGTAAREFAGHLADLIGPRGGALLAIDYGYDATGTGETLQAVAGHAFADALAAPGEADLSAHVNFAALAGIAREKGLHVPPAVTQGAFLIDMGIRERADALGLANPDAAGDIAAALDRLTSPDQMGSLFKAFAAVSPGLKPPGFPQ